MRHLGTLPMIAVGLIEETAKLMLPALLLLLGRYRRPADGLLIGVASGAGFAVLETMGYGFVVLIISHGNLSAVDGVLMTRGTAQPGRAHDLDWADRCGTVVRGGQRLVPAGHPPLHRDVPAGRRRTPRGTASARSRDTSSWP